MQKFSKKKGITLVEILCALNIIAIFSMLLISMQINNMRLRQYNNEKFKYLAVIQAVREEIIHNLNYTEVRNLMTANKKYINCDKLSLISIKSNDAVNLFEETLLQNDKSYLALQVTDGAVLKLDLTLHIKLNNSDDIITCTFFKGNYS